MNFSRHHGPDLIELIEAWKNSPHPSTKVSHYFPIYANLFTPYRQRPITLVETGVLGGGSLFMWRQWLGPEARIVGVDMNPAAEKWRQYGFEIFVGDQGDPNFWSRTLDLIGPVDVFLDDGGHQSFQQIVTVESVLPNLSNKSVLVVEDTHCSLMKDFAQHGQHSFLEYAKACSDFLTARMSIAYPSRINPVENQDVVSLLRDVVGIRFYMGMVVFEIDSDLTATVPEVLWNAPKPLEQDFRYCGQSSASVRWPTLTKSDPLLVRGQGG